MGLAMDGMASTVEVHMRAGDAALCVPPNHRWPTTAPAAPAF